MATPVSNIYATWTSVSNTYTGIGMNVTSTGYSSDSTLFNLKINGDSQFLVTPSGNVNFARDLNTNGTLYSSNVNTSNVNVSSRLTATYIQASSINIGTVDIGSTLGSSFGGTNAVFTHANSAFEQANTARTQANDAYTQANTLNITQTRLATAFNTTGAAPFYPVRAWVNFTATNPPVIKAQGNILSVTRNAAGNYTVTFATSMPSASYATTASCLDANDNIIGFSLLTANNCVITVFDNAGGKQDQGNVSAIFVC